MDSLLDMISDTDVDIEELLKDEPLCELGSEIDAPWCEKTAQWVLVVRCPTCGRSKRALLCNGCKKVVQRASKFIRFLAMWRKTKGCNHSVRKQSVTFVRI